MKNKNQVKNSKITEKLVKNKVNKNKLKIKSKTNIKKNNLKKFNLSLISKILLIVIFALGYLYVNSTFTNTISLLAVNEDSQGNINSGSIVDLSLKIKPGTGNTFISLNTIEEVDTEISIINSQKIACDLFELDCENYDFYYDFDGSALILKGPSASTAIAILTVKTINEEKIDSDVVITGSLNSGGVVGNVGGVDKKIEVAQNKGFKKVLVPAFSTYDEKIERDIQIVKVIDLVEAYNEFNGNKYNLQIPTINKSDYQEKMIILEEMLCTRSEKLKEQINFENITNKSFENSYIIQAEKSFNNSLLAVENQNYYSAASFCYNANINYRIIIQNQKNLTLEEINQEFNERESEYNLKMVQVNTDEYKNNIKTINDFYSYLVVQDRISEARDFIENGKKIEFEEEVNLKEINLTNSNESVDNISNVSFNQSVQDKINREEEVNKKQIILAKNNYLSYATERFYTIELWEKFIENKGDLIHFDKDKINQVCDNINRQINIQSELLKNYNINFLDEELSEQAKLSSIFSNQYLCIYQGLELNGKISTILNSAGIEDNNSKDYIQKIHNFTQSRISLNSNGNFPLIPYIYSEYSGELLDKEDISSSMLYSNYALAYLDLNLYLEDEKIKKSFFNEVITQSYDNIFFIFGMLFLIGFIGL